MNSTNIYDISFLENNKYLKYLFVEYCKNLKKDSKLKNEDIQINY